MTATATTIFWGAFLLFVVQPLTARRLLPWFGGTPAVWVVSLLFFQTTLVLGYTYAHLAGRYLDGRRQSIVHGALILGALFFLPLGPAEAPSASDADPTLTILGLLTLNLGLPLTTLSATSPLLQRWLAPTIAPDRRTSIYRLFALSNLGSLLGLWCYPFVLEPRTTLASQVSLWTYGYVLFAASTMVSAWYAYRVRAQPMRTESLPGGLSVRALWLGLSATGVVLLMATTNQLTKNVAAVPFLWVLPLSLYLLSFIIAFERDRWYVRPLWAGVYLATLVGVIHWLSQDDEPGFIAQLVVYSLNLFSGAMVCHGEIARSRPRTEELTRLTGLTSFYLIVALGGALGGAGVTLIAPQIFSGYWEYPVGLLAVYVLGGLAMPIEGRNRIFWAMGGLALGLLLVGYVVSERSGVTDMRRSFFGIVRISDRFTGTEAWERYLWSGDIAHGAQLMAPGRRRTPTLYYGEETGVGVALSYDLGRSKRVGVLGLGTGTLALYGHEGDFFRFYEINPDMVDAAKNDFYYLAEAVADVDVVIGDGRLELKRGEDLELDVLVLDAFTGDAIPVHLLTEEAFEIYQRHLAPDGILAVHISNLHFDLRPVMRARAEAMGAVALLVESDADDERNLYTSDWMLITTNGAFVADPELQSMWAPRALDEDENLQEFLWTDDYANLLGTLR